MFVGWFCLALAVTGIGAYWLWTSSPETMLLVAGIVAGSLAVIIALLLELLDRTRARRR
jgi:hypothetical protein